MSVSDALVAALVEIEQHVGRSGWDQPARLFALVRSVDLRAAEPGLWLGRPEPLAGALSAIEQDGFHSGDDLAATLAEIYWPVSVTGCAVALERSFLPKDAEAELPDDLEAAARTVAAHPRRMDLRVVVGVTRDGTRHGVARFRDAGEELIAGPDLVPALAQALSHTLE